MSTLVNKETRVICQGFTGKQGQRLFGELEKISDPQRTVAAVDAPATTIHTVSSAKAPLTDIHRATWLHLAASNNEPEGPREIVR